MILHNRLVFLLQRLISLFESFVVLCQGLYLFLQQLLLLAVLKLDRVMFILQVIDLLGLLLKLAFLVDHQLEPFFNFF